MTEDTGTHTGNTSPNPNGASDQPLGRMNKSTQDGINVPSKAAHSTLDRATAGAHKAVDSADEMAKDASEAFDKASAKGEELIATGTSYMREHPLIALGLAATAGYMLSRALASR